MEHRKILEYSYITAKPPLFLALHLLFIRATTEICNYDETHKLSFYPVFNRTYPEPKRFCPIYEYLIIRGFQQQTDGQVSGTLLNCSSDASGCQQADPLGYDYTHGGALINSWQNKHTILHQLQNTEYPTAIFALSRNLSLDPQIAADKKYQARVPDLLAYSNEGFDFNPFQNNLGNHGALRHEIAHNTLYISGCSVSAHADEPVLGEQIGQTVQKWLGDSSSGQDDLEQEFNETCSKAINQ